MIFIRYDIRRGQSDEGVPAGALFKLFTGKISGFYIAGTVFKFLENIVSNTSGASFTGLAVSCYNNGFVFRANAAYAGSWTRGFCETYLGGNFNYDALRIENISGFNRRVEVRNENGTLLCDNGLPWIDGTYPPDAKSHLGLAGLHAAVINPKLETALMGDETNKERVQE